MHFIQLFISAILEKNNAFYTLCQQTDIKLFFINIFYMTYFINKDGYLPILPTEKL